MHMTRSLFAGRQGSAELATLFPMCEGPERESEEDEATGARGGARGRGHDGAPRRGGPAAHRGPRSRGRGSGPARRGPGPGRCGGDGRPLCNPAGVGVPGVRGLAPVRPGPGPGEAGDLDPARERGAGQGAALGGDRGPGHEGPHGRHRRLRARLPAPGPGGGQAARAGPPGECWRERRGERAPGRARVGHAQVPAGAARAPGPDPPGHGGGPGGAGQPPAPVPDQGGRLQGPLRQRGDPGYRGRGQAARAPHRRPPRRRGRGGALPRTRGEQPLRRGH
mmetsp:Transcript_10891/g.31224  ORF Transcript_10891/g.31224 Transcript_10891/m.31224 type:complete len:279 (-) Transcript_10891:165-1001(-)